MHDLSFRTSRFWAHGDFGPIVAALRPVLVALVLTSALINILMLTSPLFMLQVYDRVLPSRSMPTLVGLCMLAAVMIAFLGLLEVLRARVLSRIGQYVDEELSPRVFALLLQRDQRSGPRGDATQCVRDLDNLRGFASGNALSALFDLPWMGIYVAVCFLFHPMMGWAVLAGVVALCLLAFLTEAVLRRPTERAFDAANSRRAFADTMKRNAGLLQALGMHGVMVERWDVANGAARDAQLRSADIACALSSVLRTFRMLLQSALLALGATLVIDHEATAGVMLAATILTVRALSPVELLIANWKALIGARQSLQRLGEALAALPRAGERTPLPAPSRSLRVTSLSLLAAGREAPVLFDVSFTLEAGSALGVIGPSGSGKSSLARALVGLWPAARGIIRLDGAELNQWSTDALGASIGYLPQDVELLPGYGGAEHRPFPQGGCVPAARGRRPGWRARHDPTPAQRLRDAGRRGRRPAVGRPAPAHRARPRALRRPVPARAGRAELQPRRRGRGRADQRDPTRARTRRRGDRRRPSPERARRRRQGDDRQRGARAGLRRA